MIMHSKPSNPAPAIQSDAVDIDGLTNLSAHLTQCHPAHGAIHRLHGIVEATNQFVMPRLVSSVAGFGASSAVLLYIIS